MSRNRLCLLIVVVILLVSISSLADLNTGIPCLENGAPSEAICQALDELNKQHYCNLQTLTCFQTVETTPSVEEVTELNLSETEMDIVDLEATVATLTEDLASTKVNMLSITNDIALIQNQLDILKNELQQDMNVVDSQIATGLAGMQKVVDTTQTTLTSIKETLSKRENFNKTIAFVLSVFIIAITIIYFTTRKPKTKLHPKIIDHITKHIKQGKKYSHLKEDLTKQGWKERDIEWAYKETEKHNYRQFKKSAPKEKKVSKPKISKPSLLHDRSKVIGIAVVSILLVVGILFILGGATGKAIKVQQWVGGKIGGYAGELTYTVECTPPHILTPDEDACCLDEKTILENGTILLNTPNAVCDTTEERQVAEMIGDVCTDNAQCGEEYCIDGNCKSLSTIYQGIGNCNKLCEPYTVKISTSDGETYSFKPKKGSYTAAGALEWKIMEMSQHCKGEDAVVPIKIIRKGTGQIINEEVITLKQGENQVLTHPGLPGFSFTLTIDEIFELCPE